MEPELAFSTDTSDLPESLASQSRIGVMSLTGDTKAIYALFNAKPELTIDEALFGLYRLHQIQKTRSQVASTLSRLAARGFIHRLSPGKYSLTQNQE
jgi:hypothetical protein